MSTDAVAIIGFLVLFALMLLRVPVGMAMGLVGVTGFGYIVGGAPTLKMIGQTSMRTVTDYTFGVIPMFLLMGAFVTVSGMSRELFRAANTWLGHLRGGLGFATILACGGFAAISGSSVATAATFSTVAYPEMRRYNYPQSFACGVVAAGGSLGAMLPPSTVLAVYGIITEQDIGKLFVAGILPGLLAISMYITTIVLLGWLRPGFLPSGSRATWKQRFESMREVWAPLLLFVFVIGGLYGGLFTPTEAGGMGAGGAFLIGVLALIMLMYLLLGCLMDALAMVILTVPIMFPVILSLGFDPIWFGVIIVMTVELGLIHPPVGMIVFVIKSVVHDVDFLTIFKGVLPFILTDLLRLTILIAFPMIALFLPSRM
jgi:C4-dicarboxylate transporter, DctM subunit